MKIHVVSLWFAWFLLPLYSAWVWLWVRKWRAAAGAKSHRSTLRYSLVGVLAALPPAPTVRLRLWVQALRLGAVTLMVLAVLRPQTQRGRTEVTASGIDIILAIDASLSMKALDLDTDQPIPQRRNRLEVVKDVVGAFVARRESDLMGLVVFGAEAYTQCPLTLDHGVVQTFLQGITPGMAGDSTAIGDGIGAAVNRLRRSEAKSKIIILLTDGSNNAGTLTPKQAAEAARALGLKVYTIGAGGRGPAPFIVDGPFGGKSVTYGAADIDEPTLQEIAQITGAAYFRAEDNTALETIYDRIDRLEKSPVKSPRYLETHELFAWLLIPALILLVIEVVLLATRLSKIP
jgi:Ca-activated chloride channel family protein